MERPTETVMVVDDTPQNLKLLSDMLKGQGYMVRALPGGALALGAALESPPDLFLLDVSMPGMDGYELCRRIKAEEKLREIPVLFISALSDTQDKVKAFGVGGLDYVTKPFHIEEVLARVRTHLKLRDLSRELENRYVELKKLEKLRDDLTHMVVHDMRAPLTTVMLHLDFILNEPDDPRMLDDAKNARQAAVQLHEMMRSLLDVSRLEEGGFPLSLKKADAVDIAKGAVKSMGPLLAEHKVCVEEPGTPVPVSCDAEIIQRVFINILGNAAKFTPPKGTISIRFEKTPEGAVMSISDSGPGIPKEFQKKIFEKFGHVDTRKSGFKRSVGLGLAFCKLAVEAHGGNIGVTSGENGGATFTFTLPAAADGASQ